MHGCDSPSVLLVDAEVESMGGVVEGGVAIAHKTSPRRLAIERIQGELRQEYNVRDETKRELEFLEKGGNPLDLLKPGDAASGSVQSTSLTNQHQDHLVTSEAKGSFAFTASPHGDSVESSGRLGANSCEPNSADNLMLFDGEHGCDKISLHPSSNKIVLPENLSHIDGSRTREHGEAAAFSVPRKAYKRRNRSRPNRDGIRLSSIDVNTSHGSDVFSLPSRHGEELKGKISEAEIQNISKNCDSNPICAKDGGKAELVDTQQDMELGDGKAEESSKKPLECVLVEDSASENIASKVPLDDQCNQQSHSGALETCIQITFDGSQALHAMEEMHSAVIECQQIDSANRTENESSSCRINGSSSEKDGTKSDPQNTTDLCDMKVLDSSLSYAQTSKSIDGNNDGDICKKITNANVNGLIKDQTLPPDRTTLVESDELVGKQQTGGVGGCALDNPESSSACLMQQENGFKWKHEDLNESESSMKNEVKNQIVNESMEPSEPRGPDSEKKTNPALDGNLGLGGEIPCLVKNQHSVDISTSDFLNGGSLTKNSTISLEAQTSPCSNSKLQPEIDEDSILKEALIIEAKRKRIAQLSDVTSVRKIRPKSRWDYVLEEMAWLANDFAQERAWKIAAAAQITSQAAFACQLRKHENNFGMEAKKVAHTLAKSIMEFWHLVEAKTVIPGKENKRDDTLAVKAYAVRFLKHNNFNVSDNKTEEPLIPDRVSDMGILGEDSLIEENLFYTVPVGAMETYRLSIISQFARCENIVKIAQEEVETSAYDANADFEAHHIPYDDDEGDISLYDMPMTFHSSKSSRFGQKKRKHLIHAYGVRSYEVSSDILPMQYAENKVVDQPTALMVKRPGGSLNVSIPTKRVRTASRRVISPFSAGTSGCIQVPNRTDASSGDTDSFQDEQSTLRDGSFVPNSLEVESSGDFNNQLPFHSAEVLTKHKKKKKPKHLNASYEPRWQVDPTFQMEQFQRDNLKKRHQLESNGNSGLYGQPVIKKPKIMRPSQENSFENIAPSPAVSQMSNMSNPNKFIKLLGGRDRGRKPKILKVPTGQLGSGSPWTLFEDQALVVLAHDLGPNWELVSDAINSTLQFKCIFRKAKECKERHNVLMDRTSVDGADSAEDSGSSQPYPSTLPGIPKGSARQLFQRLQGPMEEETLKSHFEKIIVIGKRQQYCKNQDPKQLQQPHGSHAVALSQVCPNNLNGAPVLTPLDICDATVTGPDILPIGYQGPHPGGLPIANQGPVTPLHHSSGAASALQGSPNMTYGNNFSSSPGSMRDGRSVVPRPALADEQQRMQQYNHMMTNRNVPQPNLSPSGVVPGADRGTHLLPGGNGMGLPCGINRSMPMARPGFQAIASSSMVNSGSMVSPGISSANVHSGVGTGQGNSMLRPREPMHMMRPGLSQDSQRQMAPELQMQASPGNSQVPHFGGLSSAFPNQTVSPPVSSYPLHHQPSHPVSPQPQVLSPHHPHFQGPTNHAPNPQQQAYAIRMAKERQHRLLQQQQLQHPVPPQQPQIAASSSMMPHVQSHSQLPISPTVQNSSQVQPQTATQPVPLSPLAAVSSMPQHQQKHQLPSQVGVRNAQAGGSGLPNLTAKQRQRQQQKLSQANRQHPQQRQQSQAQQPAKIAKGIGRGSLMMHQNVPVDPSLENGVSTSLGNQSSDKGDTSTHLMSNQGSFTNSALNTVQPVPTGQYASPRPPNKSLTQQKNYPGHTASSTKHLYQMTSQPDSSSQSHVPAVPSAMSSSNHQQAISHQKLVNQNQLALQRLQPNRPTNTDPAKPQTVNSDADQHLTSSSSKMLATTTLPQTASNGTNFATIASSANTHQWHASEQLLDGHASEQSLDGHSTNMSRMVSMPANACDSVTQVGQELSQRALASLPSSKHDVSAHFQQHQQLSQLSHPNSPAPLRPLPPLHSQQGQLVQAGKGDLYGRPNDQSLE
ncbi:chromatin modification-related protein EAF1 B-like isoform X3 [Salvia hispanica]|uniref:chromatin modification-related protein EAF1 B-like isoform X3 n=1 Tax=Salvia hispanica TaxID=49212 RepID=UPI0020099E48|nr:chromatin modification-related protein EAF1 B-like isoform X3 [Salvia hispanica]